MGERRRPSSKLKISRRRIVSSGDYGDFVVSNSRRESFRSCTNILESPCQLFCRLHHIKLHQMNKHDQGTHILNSGVFELSFTFPPSLFFSDYNVRSFVTTSSDYGRFLSGTSLVTGALLRRSSQQLENLQDSGL